MLKMDADRLKKNPPKLADGEVMPTRPSYWLIWVYGENGKPYHNRGVWDKVLTPVEASIKAYGIVPTENMRFYNLGTTVAGARKRIIKISKDWPQD